MTKDESKCMYVLRFPGEPCYKIGYSSKSKEALEAWFPKNFNNYEVVDIWEYYDRKFETELLRMVKSGYEPKRLMNPYTGKKVPKSRKLFQLPRGTTDVRDCYPTNNAKYCFAVVVEGSGGSGYIIKTETAEEKRDQFTWISEPSSLEGAKKIKETLKAYTIEEPDSSKKVYKFSFSSVRPDFDSLITALDPNTKNIIIERTPRGFYISRYTKDVVMPTASGFQVLKSWKGAEEDAKLFKERIATLAGGDIFKEFKIDGVTKKKRVLDINNFELDKFIDRALDSNFNIPKPPEITYILKSTGTEDFYVIRTSALSVDRWLPYLGETYKFEIVFSCHKNTKFISAIKDSSDNYVPGNIMKNASIIRHNLEFDIEELYKEYAPDSEIFSYLLYFPKSELFRYGASSSLDKVIPPQELEEDYKLLTTKFANDSTINYDLLRIEEVFGLEELADKKGKYFRVRDGLKKLNTLIEQFNRGCFKE